MNINIANASLRPNIPPFLPPRVFSRVAECSRVEKENFVLLEPLKNAHMSLAREIHPLSSAAAKIYISRVAGCTQGWKKDEKGQQLITQGSGCVRVRTVQCVVCSSLDSICVKKLILVQMGLVQIDDIDSFEKRNCLSAESLGPQMTERYHHPCQPLSRRPRFHANVSNTSVLKLLKLIYVACLENVPQTDSIVVERVLCIIEGVFGAKLGLRWKMVRQNPDEKRQWIVPDARPLRN